MSELIKGKSLQKDFKDVLQLGAQRRTKNIFDILFGVVFYFSVGCSLVKIISGVDV